MQTATRLPSQKFKTAWVGIAEQTVQRFLSTHLGANPEKTTAIVADDMIFVRAFRPFPEAEALVLSNHVNDALFQQYYDRLLTGSMDALRRDLAGTLQCGIAQIQHILNVDAQELNILVRIDTSSAIAHTSKERRQ